MVRETSRVGIIAATGVLALVSMVLGQGEGAVLAMQEQEEEGVPR